MLLKRKNRENIEKKKLINQYNLLFTKKFSSDKIYIDFFENRIDIGIESDKEVDEQYDEHISSVLDEWIPTIDKKLSLTVIIGNGAIFEYYQDINNVDIDYISELVNKIINKYDEIVDNLT